MAAEMLQTQPSAAVAPTTGPAAGTRPDALREAAQEFEAVFLAQLLAQINPPSETDAGGSADLGVFHDMFNDEMAKLISRSGGVGVADAVLKQMLKVQEVA